MPPHVFPFHQCFRMKKLKRDVILTCHFLATILVWWSLLVSSWVEIELPGDPNILISTPFEDYSSQMCWVPKHKPSVSWFNLQPRVPASSPLAVPATPSRWCPPTPAVLPVHLGTWKTREWTLKKDELIRLSLVIFPDSSLLHTGWRSHDQRPSPLTVFQLFVAGLPSVIP